MIGWGWIIAAFVLGDLVGIIAMAILFASWDKVKIKKAADAATSTADRETVRKDFFL